MKNYKRIKFTLVATCILFLLSFPFISYAQKQNNIWYFGAEAGLDFNGGAPQVLTNSVMSTIDGSATIADANGNLLFYTNSIGIWNRNHQQMANGGLSGDIDATQAVLIAKQPGNENIYYVFTNNKNSLSYSVVDINGDDGKGEVIEKSVPFIIGIHEALAGVWHCNGHDVWIVTQKINSTELCAFLLSKQGLVTTPVFSSSKFASGARFGYIKFSPQGDKIAIGRGYTRDLYNFDNSNGKITDHIFTAQINALTSFSIGFDFSPDGTKLYVSAYDPVLYQYDLLAGDSTAILLSRYDLPISFTYGWAAALGPDGKIYFNGGDNDYLHCVHNPNVKGAGCNLQEKVIYLKGKKTHIGLPLYVAGKSSISRRIAIESKSQCFGVPTSFEVKDTSELDSVRWNIKHATSGYSITTSNKFPLVTLPDTGMYEVMVIGFYECYTDTAKQYFRIYPAIPHAGFDTTICYGSSIRLSATISGNVIYQWSNGSSDSVVTVSETGKYTVHVKRGDCISTIIFNVKENPELWTALGNEYFICEKQSKSARLDAGKGFGEYRWYPTMDSSQWIDVVDAGAYFVIVKDYRGCSGSDETIVRRRCPGTLYFPNSFSPNKDGINDIYKPVGEDIIHYSMKIYNRWGEVVFETNDVYSGWNGSFKGTDCPNDVYFYTAKYNSYSSDQSSFDTHYLHNTIHLLK